MEEGTGGGGGGGLPNLPILPTSFLASPKGKPIHLRVALADFSDNCEKDRHEVTRLWRVSVRQVYW